MLAETQLSENQSETQRNLVLVGLLGRPYQLNGHIQLNSYCDNPSDIADFSALYTTEGSEPLKIKSVKVTPKRMIVRIEGVHSKEEAESFSGIQLWAKRSEFPELNEDEYYHSDLVGLKVFDHADQKSGEVVAIHNYGAGDFLEIKLSDESQSIYFPFSKHRVVSVDIPLGRIVVLGLEEFC